MFLDHHLSTKFWNPSIIAPEVLISKAENTILICLANTWVLLGAAASNFTLAITSRQQSIQILKEIMCHFGILIVGFAS